MTAPFSRVNPTVGMIHTTLGPAGLSGLYEIGLINSQAILVKLDYERSGSLVWSRIESRDLVNISKLALVATIALGLVAWYAYYHGWGENHGTMFAYDRICANLSLWLIPTAIMCLVDARRCLKAEEAARVFDLDRADALLSKVQMFTKKADLIRKEYRVPHSSDPSRPLGLGRK